MSRFNNAKAKLIESHLQILKWRLGQILPQCREEKQSALGDKTRPLALAFNRSSGSLIKKKLIELLIRELEHSVNGAKIMVNGTEPALVPVYAKPARRRK